MSYTSTRLSGVVYVGPNKTSRRKVKPAIGGVYFITCADFVKIGRSTDIEGRYLELCSANPLPMTIIGHLPAEHDLSFELEESLHQQFSKHHHRWEWFRADSELIAYVAQHTKPWPVAL